MYKHEKYEFVFFKLTNLFGKIIHVERVVTLGY